MKLIIPALVLTVATASGVLSSGPTGEHTATASLGASQSSIAATAASAAASADLDYGQDFEPVAADCGADYMRYLNGQQLDEVDVSTLSQHVRVVYPDTPAPEDAMPGRVNLDVTDGGVILGASCG